MTSPHILVISETTEDGITERDYDIECPTVTDACRLWMPCEPCTGASNVIAALEETGRAHGVAHRYIDSSWMTPTSTRFVAGHDELPDAAEYLNLPAGRHPVGHDTLDGMDLVLVALDGVSA